MLESDFPKLEIDSSFRIKTWSYISAAVKFLSNFRVPVAQKAQSKLQPTCEDIQAVILFLDGI